MHNGQIREGKHAVLIDDRSGFKIRYKDARTEWTGFRVYKGDWEPKQPQLDPEMYIQGETLVFYINLDLLKVHRIQLYLLDLYMVNFQDNVQLT